MRACPEAAAELLISLMLDTETIIIDQLLMRFEPTAVPKEVATIAPRVFCEERSAIARPRASVTPAFSRPFTSNARLKMKRRIDHEMPELTPLRLIRRKTKLPGRRRTAAPKAGQERGRPK